MSDTAFPTFRKMLDAMRSQAQLRTPRWRLSPRWGGETRQAMYHSLLHILAVAHAQRLDLAPLVHNLAAEHRGHFRRTLHRFADRLASGMPLVSALEQTPDVLSEPMILAIRFGNQSGTLAATYDQLLRSRTPESVQLQAAVRSELSYWTILLVSVVAGMAFLATVVAPTYIRIYGNLGVRLPAAFRILTGLAAHAARFPLLWIAITLGIAWLALSVRSRTFFTRMLVRPVLDPVGQARLVELLQLLATAIEAGRPIPGSLSTLAKYHFDSQLRQKLLYARNEVEQGADVWSSLTEAHILTAAESHALASSPTPAARAWLLRRLATWKQAVAYRRDAIALAMLRPVVVLLLAAIVLWLATAFFVALPHFILS